MNRILSDLPFNELFNVNDIQRQALQDLANLEPGIFYCEMTHKISIFIRNKAEGFKPFFISDKSPREGKNRVGGGSKDEEGEKYDWVTKLP